MKDLSAIAFVLFVAATFVVAANAGDDYDRADTCWQVVAAKNRIVFANTCNPDASFAVKVKDLAG
jgi:hypothetical protein